MSFKSCVYLELIRTRPMAITHNDFDIYENWVSAQLVLLLGHWARVGEREGKMRGGVRNVREVEGGTAWETQLRGCFAIALTHERASAMALNLVEDLTLHPLAANTVINLSLLLCHCVYYTTIYQTMVLYVDHIITKQIKLKLCIKISLNWYLNISPF